MTGKQVHGLGHAAPQRVRDRGTFVALRQARRGARGGLVTVRYVIGDPPARPRVAYAVNRRVGNAVVRNQVRRRLRAAMAELAPRSGAYLVSVQPAAARASYTALRRDLAGALETVVKDKAP